MTPDQFKAWFEGFCEGIADAPTREQWAKVKAKVTDLGSPVLRIDRPDLDRQRFFPAQPSFITGGGTASPMPDRGQVIAQSGQTTHRVRDLVTGSDLGPSD